MLWAKCPPYMATARVGWNVNKSHAVSLPPSGTVRQCRSSGMRSLWVRLFTSSYFILFHLIVSNKRWANAAIQCPTSTAVFPLLRAFHVAAVGPLSHEVQTGHGGQSNFLSILLKSRKCAVYPFSSSVFTPHWVLLQDITLTTWMPTVIWWEQLFF